ncbi:MAG TPA: DinB family protein [Longimicrobiales bacterium]|nr:DinB family protein [Longimicrobiales bacterium]
MTIPELIADIERARADFLAVVAALDESTASTPIGEGRWSPVQYLEHLVRAEEVTVWRMFGAVEDHRAGRGTMSSDTPDASIEEIVDRTWAGDVDAPPLAVPRLGGSHVYWAARMARNAGLVEALGELLDPSELEAVAYPHPISGAFTIRQGLAFIRFHLDRHRGHLTDAGSGPSGVGP